MVLEGGHGPERVHLLAHKHYPSCERFATGLCYDDGNLATYGAGEYQVPEFEAMRPMTEALYQLGVAEWRRAWPWLSPDSQRGPPDLCMVQRYDAWRGERGAYMGMHSDMRAAREGQRVASRGDVMSVSAGADMNFWYGVSSGAEVAACLGFHPLTRTLTRTLRRTPSTPTRWRPSVTRCCCAMATRLCGSMETICDTSKAAWSKQRRPPPRPSLPAPEADPNPTPASDAPEPPPRQTPPHPTPASDASEPPPTAVTPPCLPTRHGVWFPSRKPGQPRDGQRYAFMFRWSNGRKRAFDRTYPHRLQMTAEEKAHVAERRAAAAALAEKRKNPPASTHPMSKRTRA